MTEENPYLMAPHEAKNFLLASIVLTAGFVAMNRTYTLKMVALSLLVSLFVLSLRELGQRLTAGAMHAHTELELSISGVTLTLLGAMIAVLADIPFALLFPVYNIFSNKQYESWGYSIDVIWIKRKYWISGVGLLFMLLGWFVAYYFNYYEAAKMVALFIIFQMLPFRETVVEEELDGVHLLLYSGFMWLLFMGAAVMAFVLPV